MRSLRQRMFWAATVLALLGASASCTRWAIAHPTVNGRAFVSRDGKMLNCDATGDHPRCWHVREVTR